MSRLATKRITVPYQIGMAHSKIGSLFACAGSLPGQPGRWMLIGLKMVHNGKSPGCDLECEFREVDAKFGPDSHPTGDFSLLFGMEAKAEKPPETPPVPVPDPTERQ